jgi:hypothetical protein
VCAKNFFLIIIVCPLEMGAAEWQADISRISIVGAGSEAGEIFVVTRRIDGAWSQSGNISWRWTIYDNCRSLLSLNNLIAGWEGESINQRSHQRQHCSECQNGSEFVIYKVGLFKQLENRSIAFWSSAAAASSKKFARNANAKEKLWNNFFSAPSPVSLDSHLLSREERKS